MDGIQLEALVDSGATHNFISQSALQELYGDAADSVLVTGPLLEVKLADGSFASTRKMANINLEIVGGFAMVVSFFVLPDLAVPLILGMPWLTKVNPSIDWNSFEVKFENNQSQFSISGLPQYSHSLGLVDVQTISAKQAVRLLSKRDQVL